MLVQSPARALHQHAPGAAARQTVAAAQAASGMVVSPSTPTMVFIHSGDIAFASAFEQNAVQRVGVGANAEVEFDAVPGRVFAGIVATFADAIAPGQLQTTGTLLNPEDRSKSAGRVMVRVRRTDDLQGLHVSPGSVAQVAV
jgi:multidrug resistance efflux pump